MGRYLVTDTADAVAALDSTFPTPQETRAETAISAGALEKMKSLPVTKLVVISKDHDSHLQLVQRTFDELSRVTLDPSTDLTYTRLLRDKTYLIVIIVVGKPIAEQLKALTLSGGEAKPVANMSQPSATFDPGDARLLVRPGGHGGCKDQARRAYRCGLKRRTFAFSPWNAIWDAT
jgi:hypothetical protein